MKVQQMKRESTDRRRRSREMEKVSEESSKYVEEERGSSSGSGSGKEYVSFEPKGQVSGRGRGQAGRLGNEGREGEGEGISQEGVKG